MNIIQEITWPSIKMAIFYVQYLLCQCKSLWTIDYYTRMINLFSYMKSVLPFLIHSVQFTFFDMHFSYTLLRGPYINDEYSDRFCLFMPQSENLANLIFAMFFTVFRNWKCIKYGSLGFKVVKYHENGLINMKFGKEKQ